MQFSPAVRLANIQQMSQEPLDVVIIGGGITGAGIARDASMRGLAVALVEKEDFASGTSSKSARLVHGGLRYLEQFQFGLIRSASKERHRLRQLAPRLVHPVAFTFPVYRSSKNSLLLIRIGMEIYEFIAPSRKVKRHKIVGARQTEELEPALARDGLVGAAHYHYDCLTDDARLTLAIIKSAHEYGALIANHAEVYGLRKEGGRVSGVKVLDKSTGERFAVRARVTVNATGVWADRIRHMDDPGAGEIIRVNRGSHLVLPREKLQIRGAVAFTSADRCRAMYAVPWGHTCIVGTTDVDHRGDLDQVYASTEEVDCMLDAVNHAFPAAGMGREDIISTFAGLRPLIGRSELSAYQASRDHQIVQSDAGLVTISGGKLTTYRRMAEDLVDLVSEKLRDESGVIANARCKTARVPLAEVAFDAGSVVADLSGRYPGLERQILEHLVLTYGHASVGVLRLLREEPQQGARIVPGLPYIHAEVPYAIQNEMAMTLSDWMIRRAHIIHEDKDQGLASAPQVAATMAPYLGWDAGEVERQVEEYRQQVELSRRCRDATPGRGAAGGKSTTTIEGMRDYAG